MECAQHHFGSCSGLRHLSSGQREFILSIAEFRRERTDDIYGYFCREWHGISILRGKRRCTGEPKHSLQRLLGDNSVADRFQQEFILILNSGVETFLMCQKAKGLSWDFVLLIQKSQTGHLIIRILKVGSNRASNLLALLCWQFPPWLPAPSGVYLRSHDGLKSKRRRQCHGGKTFTPIEYPSHS